MTYASTAATIVSVAVAERINFNVYIAYVFLHSLLIFPIAAHWVWNPEGFMSIHREHHPLSHCGAIDVSG